MHFYLIFLALTFSLPLHAQKVVFSAPGNNFGVWRLTHDPHMLSHHGRDENKIEELARIEAAEFKVLSEFLTKLKNVKESGGHLLDHTAVLFGSNLGNASSHSWHNLPILLAGGGYKHGHHVAHDPKNNTPFANLFVPLAQRMGLEIEKFGSSTKSTIRGLQS